MVMPTVMVINQLLELILKQFGNHFMLKNGIQFQTRILNPVLNQFWDFKTSLEN